ncbi:MAG TPA: flagellar basal body rod C-terminal domain-containing protein, partial [Methylobacterium sp.]
LPQAQSQLDDLAAGLSRAMSDRSAEGTPVADGAAKGFDIDLTGLRAGNAVTLSLRDAAGNQRNLVLMPSNRNPPTPVSAADTADPTATVVPITVTGNPADLRSAIATALGGNFRVSAQTNLGAGGLRILSNGAPGDPTILSISASVTQAASTTDIQNGEPQLPLFIDGNQKGSLYTGSFDGGAQSVGFAQRIRVNPSVVTTTSSLVNMTATTQTGDTTRADYLYGALTSASRTFSASSGIGGVQAPYAATVQDFAQRIVDAQGAGAASAQGLDEGQAIALATAQSRFATQSGVNIDEEMSNLIALQTAYGANARVLTAARDMLDTLLRI